MVSAPLLRSIAVHCSVLRRGRKRARSKSRSWEGFGRKRCALALPDGTDAMFRNFLSYNVIQTVSRTLKEQLKFDRSKVTSLDWQSYPTGGGCLSLGVYSSNL
jgi:hypothetical protein